MNILKKFLKNRIKRNRQLKRVLQKSKNRRHVADSSSSSSSDNASGHKSSSSSDSETDIELVPQSEPDKAPDLEPERKVLLVEEVTLDRPSRTHPDSEGDDLSLHASNDELVLAANSGTSTGSQTVNVKVPTAPPKSSLVQFKDAKYKVDLTADPIQNMQRCTSRSTRSVEIPDDYVHKLSQISYGVSGLMPCAYFNVNQCSLPSPHVHPGSGLPVRFFHVCKLCYVRLGAAMFHTILDCPLANTSG